MELYQDFIIKNMPKILTQIDRDRDSRTYGSCDRNHWHLKIRDFTSAILQQSGLFLAVVYDLDFEGNLFYRDEKIREWAIATLHYWTKIQLKDGSFNEYYPWEHGFPPTSFSLYSACEIYRRFGLKEPAVEQKIRKTANYLIKHIETQALNQELASVTALYDAYLILRDDAIRNGLEKKLSAVLARQSKEGWFPEYGGADLGYLSVSLDMLTEYYWLSHDERVLEPLGRMVAFISYFVHPDGTVGGEYGSRNTTYFLPCGLQTMAGLGNRTAEAILRHLYADSGKPLYFLDAVDDRYFSHYLMHSFARALERRQQAEIPIPAPLPFEFEHETAFPEAGLYSIRKREYFTIIALKKGGLVKAFRKGEESWLDCGYRMPYKTGVVSATNWQDMSYEIVPEPEGYCVKGKFNLIKLKTSTPFLHTGLRVASFFMGNRLIGFLKKQIILVERHDHIRFERKIRMTETSVEITDTVESEKDSEITLERASNMSLRHVASGKFFSRSDLLCPNGKENISGRKILVRVTWDAINGKEYVDYEKLL